MNINPFGAHLTSIKLVNNFELFYLSPIKQGKFCKRGGVPILFPQFGNFGHLKKHGFARDLYWEELDSNNIGDEISAQYLLNIDKNSELGWGYDAKVIVTFELVKNKFLSIRIQVLNVGQQSFSFSGGLHPYFSIKSRKDLKIIGLEGVKYIDTDPLINTFNLNSFDGVERLFLSNVDLDFFNGYNSFKISTSGFENWMIWNPGKDGGEKINDLPANDFDRFICIEPVIANDNKKLEPGQDFIGELLINIL